jgi:GT2 family glycosyltransferase
MVDSTAPRRLAASPLIVAGMHCSATSLAASLLAGLGVNMGDHLLAADAHNPAGYFEDVGFLELQSRMMLAAAPADDGGHPDWGWTEHERLDPAAFEAFRDAARDLTGERAAAARPWGWKNPRTSVSLDFWDSLLPEARYLFVYRFPWEVADSMQRLGAEVFLRHPEYAYRIWSFYNRHLLTFAERAAGRCLLVSANALFAGPDLLDRLLRERFDLPVADGFTRSRIRPGLFRAWSGQDPLVHLLDAVRPECLELLRRLDQRADLGASGLWGPTPRAAWALGGSSPAPKLSVVIPCYNHGELLLEAVASAERAAAEEPLELVVVNDGSDEPWTLQVLAALRRLGYRIVDQENRGLAAARNAGIASAHGDYLLPLDADNRLRPGFPQAAARVLDAEPEVGVVYGARYELGLRSGVVEVPELDLDGLLRANYIDACAVLRREVWEQCGGYDSAMAQGWEDWDLWIGAAERGWRFHRLPGVTFDYRVRPSSMTTALLRAEVGEPLRIYMFDKHHDLYRRRLPALLTAQHEVAQAQAALAEVAADRDRLRILAESLTAERDRLRAEGERLAAERGRLRAEGERLAAEGEALRAELAAERQRMGGERNRLEAERDRLYAELESWRRRVAFMEGTRSWKLRNLSLRLRRRLRS